MSRHERGETATETRRTVFGNKRIVKATSTGNMGTNVEVYKRGMFGLGKERKVADRHYRTNSAGRAANKAKRW
jgi:hypothetical protein